jgi:predicted anti-sigma-YlaC factor YlaD
MFRFAMRAAALSAAALTMTGCSIKRMAINSLGNALSSGSSSAFATDEDPELVRDAVPFALKTIESLLEQSPRHVGLLTAAASGFTQYGYAFVQQEADVTEATDLTRATAMRVRAKKLYLRAAGYGLRGLDVQLPGFKEQVLANPEAALARASAKQVPLLYWTGAAWAAALAIDVNDSELAIKQTVIEKMMRRALTLDDGWDRGSLHEFFIAWEAGHAAAGGSMASAREHFARATALSGGTRVGPYVSLAESVAMSENNKKEFDSLLKQALAVDLNAAPQDKLANVINQRRARWLLGRIDDLFVN